MNKKGKLCGINTNINYFICHIFNNVFNILYNKIKRKREMKIKQILLYIHQLPQNILGFCLTRKANVIQDFKLNDGTTTKVYFTNNVFGCGVSLGNYIVLDNDVYYEGCHYRRKYAINTVNHEHGHQIQSLYFGWFYLIFVGLISAVFNNLWDRVFHKKWDSEKRSKWYYNRYPEKWADELGKVNRNV